MVLPLLALGAGTALSMYGAQKKRRALQNTEGQYQQLVQELMKQRQLAARDYQGNLGQLSQEHNVQLGGAVDNWLGADKNATADPAYAPNVQATVASLRDKTPEQNPWNADNGAAQSAIAGQDAHATTNLNNVIAAGQATDHQRRLGLMRDNALQPYTQGEMERSSKLNRLQQQFQLRNAMLGSQFQLDQTRLQGDMNAAGRAGDHGIMWGTLLQQLGGMGGGSSQNASAGQAAQDPGMTQYNLDNGGWAGYDYPQGNEGGMYA